RSLEKSLIGRQVKLALQLARMMTASTAPFEQRINILVKTDVVGVGGLNRHADRQAKEKGQHRRGGCHFVAAACNRWLPLMVNKGILIHSNLLVSHTFLTRLVLNQWLFAESLDRRTATTKRSARAIPTANGNRRCLLRKLPSNASSFSSGDDACWPSPSGWRRI